MYAVIGQLDKWRMQTIRVFRSKKVRREMSGLKGGLQLITPPLSQVYNPGEVLVLGGPGLADIMDTMYVVAFHQEMQEIVSKQSTLDYLPRGLRSADLSDFGQWYTQMIKSIKRNRLAEVIIMLATGVF